MSEPPRVRLLISVEKYKAEREYGLPVKMVKHMSVLSRREYSKPITMSSADGTTGLCVSLWIRLVIFATGGWLVVMACRNPFGGVVVPTDAAWSDPVSVGLPLDIRAPGATCGALVGAAPSGRVEAGLSRSNASVATVTPVWPYREAGFQGLRPMHEARVVEQNGHHSGLRRQSDVVRDWDGAGRWRGRRGR
jgi:hypothetical protein